jgi:hypothetical protein
MYILPGYAEVRAALGDPDTFCSGQGVGLNDVINGIAAGGNTLMTDGQLHDHLRSVIGSGLTPRALRPARQRRTTGRRPRRHAGPARLVRHGHRPGPGAAAEHRPRPRRLARRRSRPPPRLGRGDVRPARPAQRPRRAGRSEGAGHARVRRPHRRRMRRPAWRPRRGHHRRGRPRRAAARAGAAVDRRLHRPLAGHHHQRHRQSGLAAGHPPRPVGGAAGRSETAARATACAPTPRPRSTTSTTTPSSSTWGYLLVLRVVTLFTVGGAGQ